MPLPSRSATCHPERKHCAKGLCKSCYEISILHRRPKHVRNKVLANKRRRNKRTRTKEKNRVYALRRYGLTPEQYESILVQQGGVCDICKTKSDRPLFVDHDHETKKVRGLLCGRCNVGIGMLCEDLLRIASASSYLLKHKAQT